MWGLMNEYKSYWNGFCGILAKFHSSNKVINTAEDDMVFKGSVSDVKAAIKEEKGFFNLFKKRNESDNKSVIEERQLERAYKKFNEIMSACKTQNLLKTFSYTSSEYKYEFKNKYIANCLKKAGNVLEQHVYQKVKESRPDITEHQVGVEIDWDIIDTCKATEVSNEIDVFGLKGYVPVFISCKAEKISNVKQEVLYELDVVARRLGGKYAKKILAITDVWRGKHRNRAEEMGIEVWEEIR